MLHKLRGIIDTYDGSKGGVCELQVSENKKRPAKGRPF